MMDNSRLVGFDSSGLFPFHLAQVIKQSVMYGVGTQQGPVAQRQHVTAELFCELIWTEKPF